MPLYLYERQSTLQEHFTCRNGRHKEKITHLFPLPQVMLPPAYGEVKLDVDFLRNEACPPDCLSVTVTFK